VANSSPVYLSGFFSFFPSFPFSFFLFPLSPYSLEVGFLKSSWGVCLWKRKFGGNNFNNFLENWLIIDEKNLKVTAVNLLISGWAYVFLLSRRKRRPVGPVYVPCVVGEQTGRCQRQRRGVSWLNAARIGAGDSLVPIHDGNQVRLHSVTQPQRNQSHRSNMQVMDVA